MQAATIPTPTTPVVVSRLGHRAGGQPVPSPPPMRRHASGAYPLTPRPRPRPQRRSRPLRCHRCRQRQAMLEARPSQSGTWSKASSMCLRGPTAPTSAASTDGCAATQHHRRRRVARENCCSSMTALIPTRHVWLGALRLRPRELGHAVVSHRFQTDPGCLFAFHENFADGVQLVGSWVFSGVRCLFPLSFSVLLSLSLSRAVSDSLVSRPPSLESTSLHP